jgi:signal-transduction protein with cAMP-binding, CBS, and nucleotidyltransferase domain
MNQAHCGTLVIVDRGGHCVGILTDRDLAIAIGKTAHPPAHVLARDAMTTPVLTCSPDDSLANALERMTDARIRRLPVLDDANATLEGIVSIDDIVLWGVQHGGVERKELLRALRAICAANERLLSTETLDESFETVPDVD